MLIEITDLSTDANSICTPERQRVLIVCKRWALMSITKKKITSFKQQYYQEAKVRYSQDHYHHIICNDREKEKKRLIEGSREREERIVLLINGSIHDYETGG